MEFVYAQYAGMIRNISIARERGKILMRYCLLYPFHKFILRSHHSLHFMMCELINSPEDAQQSGKEVRSVPS